MNKPIVLVVGARPNFVKASPIFSAMRERKINTILIHRGQHYDYEFSKTLFEDFPWLRGGDDFIPISPIGYIDFLSLECYAEAVLTDSGGDYIS